MSDFEEFRRIMVGRQKAAPAKQGEFVELAMPNMTDNHLGVEMKKHIITRIIEHNRNENVPANKLPTVKSIERVYAPDETGTREVLYIDYDGYPQTAYVTDIATGFEVTLAEGW